MDILPPLSDMKSVCKFLFNVDIYPYQEQILNSIFHGKKRKISVRSTTRAGKSFAVAMAAILYAIFNDNVRVGLIAPTYDKTRVIMDYVVDLLCSNPIFDDIVMFDSPSLTRMERLKKEVSKRRMTFRNGSIIEIKSVDIKSRGFGVLGFGYNLIIIDESPLIPTEAFQRIFRMLVEAEDTVLFEIGNPLFLNHFYEHHNSPEWEKIHVRWQDCVACGRMTKEAIDDQRRELTDLEFTTMFDAEFPMELEFAVFTKELLDNAMQERDRPEKIDKYLIGVDVGGGRDLSVITIIAKSGGVYYFWDYYEMDTRDTTVLSDKVMEVVDDLGIDNCFITVDTVGIGHGVNDVLKKKNYHSRGFVAGEQARNNIRFANMKTEAIFGMADLFREGRFFNLPPSSRYTLQLRAWIYERKMEKQLRVVDPKDKSPDFADSLCYSLCNEVYGSLPKPRVGEEPKISSINKKPIARTHSVLRKR